MINFNDAYLVLIPSSTTVIDRIFTNDEADAFIRDKTQFYGDVYAKISIVALIPHLVSNLIQWDKFWQGR